MKNEYANDCPGLSPKVAVYVVAEPRVTDELTGVTESELNGDWPIAPVVKPRIRKINFVALIRWQAFYMKR